MEYTVIFLPLIGAIIGYLGGSLIKYFSEITTSLLVSISSILSLTLFWSGIQNDTYGNYKIFEWMSLQRNLKAIGTFAYQHKVLGNDRYLKYIEPTLNYIRQTLANRSDLDFLGPALVSAIPTLNTN